MLRSPTTTKNKMLATKALVMRRAPFILCWLRSSSDDQSPYVQNT